MSHRRDKGHTSQRVVLSLVCGPAEWCRSRCRRRLHGWSRHWPPSLPWSGYASSPCWQLKVLGNKKERKLGQRLHITSWRRQKVKNVQRRKCKSPVLPLWMPTVVVQLFMNKYISRNCLVRTQHSLNDGMRTDKQEIKALGHGSNFWNILRQSAEVDRSLGWESSCSTLKSTGWSPQYLLLKSNPRLFKKVARVNNEFRNHGIKSRAKLGGKKTEETFTCAINLSNNSNLEISIILVNVRLRTLHHGEMVVFGKQQKQSVFNVC